MQADRFPQFTVQFKHLKQGLFEIRDEARKAGRQSSRDFNVFPVAIDRYELNPRGAQGPKRCVS